MPQLTTLQRLEIAAQKLNIFIVQGLADKVKENKISTEAANEQIERKCTGDTKKLIGLLRYKLTFDRISQECSVDKSTTLTGSSTSAASQPAASSALDKSESSRSSYSGSSYSSRSDSSGSSYSDSSRSSYSGSSYPSRSDSSYPSRSDSSYSSRSDSSGSSYSDSSRSSYSGSSYLSRRGSSSRVTSAGMFIKETSPGDQKRLENCRNIITGSYGKEIDIAMWATYTGKTLARFKSTRSGTFHEQVIALIDELYSSAHTSIRGKIITEYNKHVESYAKTGESCPDKSSVQAGQALKI